MKNLLLLLGVLFISTASFAQNMDGEIEGPDSPEVTADSLEGSADGFNIRNGDDKLDFGLVIPTLSKIQVMDFNLSYVLSSETSVIRAVGQRINVPSNLSLPRQSERYSFFTVRIDKPEFKLPIATAELPEEVVILEGSFPFTTTVDTLRAGRPLFSVINSFNFQSYSLSPVENPEAPLSLTVGANSIEGEELQFSNPLTEDEDFVSLGLSMASTPGANGATRHFPVDVKTLENPELLRTDIASNTTPIVVSIPKAVFDSSTDASEKPFPFTMVWGEATPEFSLPLAKSFISIESQADQSVSGVKVDFAKITAGVTPIALKLTLTDSEGNITANLFTTEGLESEVTVELASNVDTEERLRVDVYAVDADPIKASIIVENALTEADILQQAKYITRYEEDIKENDL